jgi:hypothetical protein
VTHEYSCVTGRTLHKCARAVLQENADDKMHSLQDETEHIKQELQTMQENVDDKMKNLLQDQTENIKQESQTMGAKLDDVLVAVGALAAVTKT